MPDIQLVEVTLGDLKNLQEISRRTFYQSFAAVNTPENMKFFLDHHYSDEKLSSEIKNPDSRFFFAQTGKEILGYLKLNLGGAQTVLPNYEGLEIERIYIDQTFKSRGIGQVFIQQALAVANEIKARYLWLGVWEHNPIAIRFYEKNEFRPFSKHIFKLGDDEQTDLLMKRVL
jgi:ribosomal protein S18 acetylase RimI-like enzyme